MAERKTPHITIIGAGLAGLSLALHLHQQGIPSEVYESRSAPLNIGGAIMLSPNALKVLDKLGIYSDVVKQGYEFRELTWQTLEGTTLERQSFGNSDQYGYDGLRLHRYILIKSFVDALKAAGVPVNYGKKFLHAVEEDSSVTISFADGTSLKTDVLVGADGIHSTVRRHMYPDLKPKFLNLGGVTAAVPTSGLNFSAEQLKNLESPSLPRPLPLTILHPVHGAMTLAPQGPGAKEIFFGRQLPFTDTDHAGWDARSADKENLAGLLASEAGDFPQIVQDLVKDIPHKSINLWPFYVIPKLSTWVSKEGSGRVVLLGDAAHAIPPSAGQGVNQAFEDIYTLGLAFARLSKEPQGGALVHDILKKWETFRLDRVERVFALNGVIEARRTPDVKRTQEQRALAEKKMELGWLYNVDFQAEVDSWF